MGLDHFQKHVWAWNHPRSQQQTTNDEMRRKRNLGEESSRGWFHTFCLEWVIKDKLTFSEHASICHQQQTGHSGLLLLNYALICHHSPLIMDTSNKTLPGADGESVRDNIKVWKDLHGGGKLWNVTACPLGRDVSDPSPLISMKITSSWITAIRPYRLCPCCQRQHVLQQHQSWSDWCSNSLLRHRGTAQALPKLLSVSSPSPSVRDISPPSYVPLNVRSDPVTFVIYIIK